MREFSKAIRWVVALKCEAEPIIQYFKMDCYINTGPFSVFCDREKEHWLVLSGVGQINSASATTYLSEISDAPPWAGWINIGIAGYGGKKNRRPSPSGRGPTVLNWPYFVSGTSNWE